MTTKGLEDIVDAVGGAAPARERYRGVMLGLAAGNCLGLPVEGQSHHWIRRHHPGGVRDVDPAERERPWDDDVAHSLIVAEALLSTQDVNPDDIGRRLVVWRDQNGRGIGQLNAEVIAEIASGRPVLEAARVVWERSGWSSAGNGAVMRCAPVALRHRRSGAALVRNARLSARVTHHDARCEWSTVVVDVSLAVALAGGTPDLDELATATERVAEGEAEPAVVDQVVDAIREARDADLEGLELDDPMDMGYTLKAMQVALWCCRQEGSFEDIVSDVVTAGGDADTNGSVAGAVMGARATSEAIPRRWIEALPASAQLVELADRLLDASSG
jgi:ADP-ribosylglycohydrolase